MRNQIRYQFNYNYNCNMCSASSEKQKIMGIRLNQAQGRSPRNKIGISTTICKCKNCGLIYSNPQPVPLDIQDHYGVPPESYWVPEYFIVNDNYFRAGIERLKKLMPIKEGMKTLDIGAGIGKQMIALSKEGFDAYGLEPSKPFYEKAVEKMGISPDKLKLTMLETAEYPENHFDFISLGVVLEHLYDPSASILRAMKWLKPNGLIHVEVPSADWFVNKLINFFYFMKGSAYVGNLSPMHSPYHLYEFALKSFVAHAKLHKYEIAFHEYFVCKTFMPKIIDFFIKPYMRWTNTGMELSLWLRKTQ